MRRRGGRRLRMGLESTVEDSPMALHILYPIDKSPMQTLKCKSLACDIKPRRTAAVSAELGPASTVFR